MTQIGHKMILASAGSGKTHALTNRYVRLLALGARPERIVALTFTRKAAGEFFDGILTKLAGAARDPAAAAGLAGEIGMPGMTAGDFLGILRRVADAMHRLRLGTFDGFFARIARNFPLELGLTGPFEILQEHGARMERSRVLQRLFRRTGGLSDSQREFIEAFKRATFGADEKRLGAQLDAFLDEHQEVYLAAPSGEVWGNPDRIWPAGNPWLGAAGQLEAAAAALGAAIGAMAMSEGQRARWESFFAELAAWSPGAPMGKAAAYLFENALEAWPALETVVVDRRDLVLAAPARDALRRLLQSVIGGELARRLEMTRGIHAVLAGYEAIYGDAVRRAGKLTFGDVQRLLAPDAGGWVLSRSDRAEGSLAIDYRLDSEIDHWLLDEFQDTSFGQWSVLRNLIDEVIQDPTGARSFFYVGDVKQAIFAWREGDARLFREIFDHYNLTRSGAIEEERLDVSYRSGPAVIEMVNRVFGAPAVLSKMFPGAASRSWNREWIDHKSARAGLGGQAAWIYAADEDARFGTALRLIQEIAPLGRALTCAVLVQDNRTAASLADFLRREGGLPAVADSDLHVCCDNPLGAALLALVKAAAHPGDTLARGHLQMTPLWSLIVEEGLDGPGMLSRRLLADIHGQGFERTLDVWRRRIEPLLAPDDAFSRERARQFTAAAGRFDATGSRDIAEFLHFMARFTARDGDSADVIRVMTIHKSKGLGFDLVILPDLEGTRIDRRRTGLAVQRSKERSVEWVLHLPGEIFHDADPVLASHVREAKAEACYENLSLLYVAMTRAKRATYVIAKPPGSSRSLNFSRLLGETLGESDRTIRVGNLDFPGAWSSGDPSWHVGIEAKRVSPFPETMVRPDVSGLHAAPRPAAKRASAEGGGIVAGASLFSIESAAAAEFGTAIHRLLAKIAWADSPGMGEMIASWPKTGPARPGTTTTAGDEACACFNAPTLAELWRRPAGGAVDLWRERPFDVVVDGVWVSGIFDRVAVECGPDGRPLRATVFDFKSGQDVIDPDKHGAQLNAYRRAAAMLAGLPVAAVACELIVTHSRRRIAVPL